MGLVQEARIEVKLSDGDFYGLVGALCCHNHLLSEVVNTLTWVWKQCATPYNYW